MLKSKNVKIRNRQLRKLSFLHLIYNLDSLHKIYNIEVFRVITKNFSSQNIVFPTFRLSDLQSLDTQDSAYQLVEAEEGLRSSLTIYSLSQPEQYYRLHLELSQRKIAEMEQTIEELQEDIVMQSPHTPAKGEDLKWPIGVNAPTVPKNRFDLVEWTYFNQTHLFRPDDFLVVTPIVGSHLRSMQMVLLYAKKEMEDRYIAEDFKLSKVVNGYVRFDPARGMEYLLDMEFQVCGDIFE